MDDRNVSPFTSTSVRSGPVLGFNDEILGAQEASRPTLNETMAAAEMPMFAPIVDPPVKLITFFRIFYHQEIQLGRENTSECDDGHAGIVPQRQRRTVLRECCAPEGPSFETGLCPPQDEAGASRCVGGSSGGVRPAPRAAHRKSAAPSLPPSRHAGRPNAARQGAQNPNAWARFAPGACGPGARHLRACGWAVPGVRRAGAVMGGSRDHPSRRAFALHRMRPALGRARCGKEHPV